ncbi:MAG: PilZ domain-containing protein [Myxococcota bacterium]
MSAWNPKKQGERRSFQRLPGEYRVRFVEGSTWIETTTRDMSQGGMLIERQLAAAPLIRARFELHLVEGEPPIGVDGIVRRIDEAGAHIEFQRGRREVAKKIRQIIETSVIPDLERSLGQTAAGRDTVIELAGWYNDVGRLSGAVRLYRAVQEQGFTGIALFENMADWLLSAAQRAEDPRPVLGELERVLRDSKAIGTSDILEAVKTEVRGMQDALAAGLLAQPATAPPNQAAGRRPVRGSIDLVMNVPVVEKRRTEAVVPLAEPTIGQLWSQLWKKTWGAALAWVRGNPVKAAVGAGVVVAALIVVIAAWPDSDDPGPPVVVADRALAKTVEPDPVESNVGQKPAIGRLSSAVEEELFEEWGPEPDLLASPPEEVLEARRARRRALRTRTTAANDRKADGEALWKWGKGADESRTSSTSTTAGAVPAARSPAETVTASERNHYAAGVRHLKAKKPTLAIPELEAALKVNPRHAEVHLGLALAYALLGRRTRALEMYERFIEIAPDHPKAAKVRRLLAAQR